MEKQKVYFTTFKTSGSENLLQKLHRLMKQAGFENIDMKDKYAAIMEDHKVHIDHDKCVGCGRCLAVCPKDAIAADFSDSVAMLNYKMAEYAYAVCKDRPCFHMTHPDTEWKTCIEHAVKIGLGTNEYELITI